MQISVIWCMSYSQSMGRTSAALSTCLWLERIAQGRAARQCGDRDSNMRPADLKSSALTATLPTPQR